jgi:hypothetical protein
LQGRRQVCRQAGRHVCRQANRQTDRQAGRPAWILLMNLFKPTHPSDSLVYIS